MVNKMNTELLELFNKLINLEFYTGYLYYAMSTYFDEIMMNGFSMYMKHQASFELDIAQKMYDYLILRNEKLLFLKINEPKTNRGDVSDIFNQILVHEKILSDKIYELNLKAEECSDMGAIEFLREIKNKKLKTLKTIEEIVSNNKNSPAFVFS